VQQHNLNNSPDDLTADQAVKERLEVAARAAGDPIAFLSLSLARQASSLQAKLVSLALEHESFYAEIPRGHAKTTTLAVLVAWWLGVRPNTRFKIVSQSDETATATSRYIREVVRSKAFRAAFPNVRLDPSSENVMSWRVIAPGIGPKRDPSVQASGVMGRTGGRADIIWFDDICDMRNSILYPTMRSHVIDSVENIWTPMLDPSTDFSPRVWRTATPFHVDDITARWRTLCEAQGSLLRLPCHGELSPWPEVFTPEVLRQRRSEMGPIAYARAFELVPISQDAMVFRPDWIRTWKDLPPPARTVASIDWGYGRDRQNNNDPDYSVCLVGEIDAVGHLRLTDILRVRESFPVFTQMATNLCLRRGVSTVLAECNGPQRGIFDAFRDASHLPLFEVRRIADKHMRAAEAQAFVQGGKLFLPGGIEGKVAAVWQDALDELCAFPAGVHDDCVDCIVDLCMEAAKGLLLSSRVSRRNPFKKRSVFDASGPRHSRVFG
jgi:phage terminase large subunit-like protein